MHTEFPAQHPRKYRETCVITEGPREIVRIFGQEVRNSSTRKSKAGAEVECAGVLGLLELCNACQLYNGAR